MSAGQHRRRIAGDADRQPRVHLLRVLPERHVDPRLNGLGPGLQPGTSFTTPTI